MDQGQLSKIWAVIGSALIYYCLDSWIVAQGGAALFGIDPIVTGKAPIAVTAIPICSVLLAILSATAWLHAARARAQGGAWHARIPLAWFDSANTGSPEGQCYQATTAFLLTVVPLIALGYIWSVVGQATIVLKTGGPTGMWSWPTSSDDPARICSNTATSMADCGKDATFLPFVEPLLFILVTAVAVVATAGFIREALRPQRVAGAAV